MYKFEKNDEIRNVLERSGPDKILAKEKISKTNFV